MVAAILLFFTWKKHVENLASWLKQSMLGNPGSKGIKINSLTFNYLKILKIIF